MFAIQSAHTVDIYSNYILSTLIHSGRSTTLDNVKKTFQNYIRITCISPRDGKLGRYIASQTNRQKDLNEVILRS